MHKLSKKTKRFIFTLLLIGFVYVLYKVYFLTSFIVSLEGTGFYIFRIYTEVVQNRNIDFFKSAGVIILSAIPIGFFFPLAKGKRCINKTLMLAALMGTVTEIMQFVLNRGMACYDDMLYCIFGAWIGYKLFVFVCNHTSDGGYFLWPPREDSKKGLILYLSTTIILLGVWVNIDLGKVKESISSIDLNKIKPKAQETEDTTIIPSSSELIYDTIYSEMKEHKASYRISGITGVLTSEEIYEQFRNVLDAHPEFFWLTGNSEGQSLSSGPTITYMIFPGMNCDLKGVPAKEEQLNEVIDAVVQMAQAYESDYDKAAFVHDYIVINCEYDTKTFYQYLYAPDNRQITTHAYDCYGCLVEHTAVCSGYSKAYKLLLNRLGIECDVVSGEGNNSLSSGPHAWNRVVIDGKQYYVDVTWDDPLTDGYVLDYIPRDYFMLSYDEISKDHFEE